MSNVRRAAFFDLDNTVIRGSSFYYFAKGLTQRGHVTRRQIAKFALQNFKFIMKREEDLHLISDVTRKALHFVTGKSQDFFAHLCEEIVKEFLPQRLFSGTSGRINEHKALGDDTWLVTAAPIEIADVIARELGMSGAIGTQTFVKNGVFSGELVGGAMHGIKKSHAIRTLASKNNYDLEKSFAYTDSINDLPMLLSVGNPFIVNPNKDLLRVAEKNRWPVLSTVA